MAVATATAAAAAAAVLRGGGGGVLSAAGPSMSCSCSTVAGGGLLAWEASYYRNSRMGSNALLTCRPSSSLPFMGGGGTRFDPMLRARRRSSSLQLRIVARNPDVVDGHAKASQFVQDARKFDVSRNGTARIEGTELGKVLTPIVASAGFYLQDAASALEEVVKAESPPDDLLVIVLTSGFYAFLYFLVVPAIVYNYLRLRWYKRNAAETFFQFMLVFVFFPGMLLLAPFINFRRLPKEGTEPP